MSEWVYIDEQGREVGQANSNTNHSPYTTTKTDKADLLDKIKPDLIVEIIRHKLMGEEFINNQWQKVKSLESRAISEVGAWNISNLMLAVSSQNVSLSRLKDHEIRARTLEIMDTVHDMLLANWEEYGITSSDQISFVHQIVMSNTLITLKQTENAGIRALIQGTTTEVRSVSQIENQSKRRWFGLRNR